MISGWARVRKKGWKGLHILMRRPRRQQVGDGEAPLRRQAARVQREDHLVEGVAVDQGGQLVQRAEDAVGRGFAGEDLALEGVFRGGGAQGAQESGGRAAVVDDGHAGAAEAEGWASHGDERAGVEEEGEEQGEQALVDEEQGEGGGAARRWRGRPRRRAARKSEASSAPGRMRGAPWKGRVSARFTA